MLRINGNREVGPGVPDFPNGGELILALQRFGNELIPGGGLGIKFRGSFLLILRNLPVQNDCDGKGDAPHYAADTEAAAHHQGKGCRDSPDSSIGAATYIICGHNTLPAAVKYAFFKIVRKVIHTKILPISDTLTISHFEAEVKRL